MTKKIIQCSLHILYYSLDSDLCGSANIANPVMSYFIPIFIQRTSQGSHIFVLFVAQSTNVAIMTHALKKEWDEIIPDNLCDICATSPRRINAVVQNGRSYVE